MCELLVVAAQQLSSSYEDDKNQQRPNANACLIEGINSLAFGKHIFFDKHFVPTYPKGDLQWIDSAQS